LYDLWQFNSSTNEWIEMQSFPGVLPPGYDNSTSDRHYSIQQSHLINFIHNDKIYLVTGETYDQPEMWSFDTTEEEWIQIEDLNFFDNEARELFKVRGGTIGFTYEDKCYFLFGSWLNYNVDTGYVHEFDPTTNTWSNNIVVPESGAGAFTIVTERGIIIGTDYSQYLDNGYGLWRYKP
jgi:hypothetical protein